MKRRHFLLGLSSSLWASAWPALVGAVESENPIQKIAFGSCAMQWKQQPIWASVLLSEPDLFLFLGDAIYGDFDGEKRFEPSRESLLRDWKKLAAKPGFKALREKVPVLATWDNHDYGHHNAGSDYAQKELARELFLDFFGVAEGSPRRTRDGIYDAVIIGPPGKRVQIILLDNRWNRGALMPDRRSEEEREALGLTGSMGHTPNTDSSASLLGEAQWQWLENQLQLPAELRLICSGTQIINDTKGMQEWGNFPNERERLFHLIETSGAGGVIFLSGNVHYSELSRMDTAAYPLFDFTSSGMTHNSEQYARYPSSYRVAGPCADNNFGLLEIDWQAENTIVSMSAIGLDNRAVFTHSIRAANLVSR